MLSSARSPPAAPQLNPKIRSARFKETLLPATYRKIRWNFFRVHFHFLMANEVAGEYDYLLRVAVADSADYERLHRKQLAAFPHVARIRTHFTLRRVSHRLGFEL